MPHYALLPVLMLPQELRNRLVAQALSLAFVRERQHGDLDFLEQRRVRIALSDVDLDFTITVQNRQILPVVDDGPVDLTVGGSLHDYLLLVTSREDPDTLFFQRRLHMQGNTGLGVHLKNFLAGVDLTSIPLGNVLQPTLSWGLSVYEWLAR
ncbi:hypothetical protein TI04_05720 [Achromatium sp. WMS2]|nr:hypothetical protein TI04_05720 [Achromatium sp. WMS2]